MEICVAFIAAAKAWPSLEVWSNEQHETHTESFIWNSIQFQDVSGPRYSSRRDSSYFVESTWDPRCPQTKKLFSCTLLALLKGDFENSRVNISVSSRNWVRRDRKRAQARKWVESGVKMFTTTLFLQNVYFVFGIAVSILFLKAARFDPWPESGRQSVEWLKHWLHGQFSDAVASTGKTCCFFVSQLQHCKIETHRNTWTLFTANLLMHPVLQGQALQQWCRDFLERHRHREHSPSWLPTWSYFTHVASCSPLFGHVQTYSEHVLPTNWFSSTQVHVFPTSVAQSHPLSHILDRLR